MYSVVLATMMAAGTATPDSGTRFAVGLTFSTRAHSNWGYYYPGWWQGGGHCPNYSCWPNHYPAIPLVFQPAGDGRRGWDAGVYDTTGCFSCQGGFSGVMPYRPGYSYPSPTPPPIQYPGVTLSVGSEHGFYGGHVEPGIPHTPIYPDHGVPVHPGVPGGEVHPGGEVYPGGEVHPGHPGTEVPSGEPIGPGTEVPAEPIGPGTEVPADDPEPGDAPPSAEPIPSLPMEKPPAKEEPAALVIRAPLDVQIRVNGQALVRDSEKQEFLSPKLPVGRRFSYTISAEAERNGKLVRRSKKVLVQGGFRQEIDFAGLESTRARVTIKLPADAKLFVENAEVPVDSTEKTFETPELQQGRAYRYTMKAKVVREGKTVEQTKRVEVMAGKAVNVVFDELTSLETVSSR